MDEVEFGRYRLLSMLGEGGMGEVWRAHDTVTDRDVAIKVLSAKLSQDEDFQQRFRREAHSAARLNTPHVVPIHDYGEIDGRLFVCMRLIEGRDLAVVLADGPLEPARAARIIGQVAEALNAAHKIGLIHRDIKPSNILLDDNDFAYLIDFGIARVADETRMTKTGNTIGTFAYIAPERFNPSVDEDARVDIYSLACVLYETLTGAPPFPDDTMPHLIAAHLNTPPPRPSIARPDVPAPVDAVIATGMAKDPNQRYATTIELADAARDALTVPIQRPASAPTALPATEASGLAAAQPPWQQPAYTYPAASQPAAPQPQSRAGVIAALALGAVVIVAVAVVVTVQLAKPRTAPVASPSATALSIPPTYASPSPAATSPPTTTPAVTFAYFSILDGRQCRVTTEQVNCQPCKPLQRLNAVAWCDEQPKGYAVDTAGSLDDNPPAFGSAPGAEEISPGQTYHELGWTITTDGGWIRFTNDATGHGIAVGGQNRFTF